MVELPWQVLLFLYAAGAFGWWGHLVEYRDYSGRMFAALIAVLFWWGVAAFCFANCVFQSSRRLHRRLCQEAWYRTLFSALGVRVR